MRSTTSQPCSRLAYGVPFSVIKDKVLGKKYELSLTFVGDARMRTLNRTYRNKDATTDILSFPLSQNSGEIFISIKEAAKRSKQFTMKPHDHLLFLFIHGLLHLKGFEHGRTMEKQEHLWCKRFSVVVPKG